MGMQDRVTKILLFAVTALLAAFVFEPYVARYFYAAETPRAVTPRGDLTPAEQSTIELFRRTSPSVVHVFAQASRGALGPDGGQGAQTGTGFVWDAAGHVVTNNHVVQGANALQIRLANGEIVGATLVGRAPNYDLAVLRLGRVTRAPPPLPVGSSADLQVGQAVFAIGNPFGLDQTLTTGVISALQRRLPTNEGREVADVIQTDAAINPGNSGGPLLDSAGRLIGVNTAIYSPSGASAGIGFAIPVDVVNRVVPDLIRTGRVPTPGIGILIADESAVARLGIEGVVIVGTQRGSSAQRAGLEGIDRATGELGDVIVGAEGEPVRRLADLVRVLQRVGVGRTVRLTVERDGRRRQVDVAVADIGTQAP
jgi:2-alkenal reductase